MFGSKAAVECIESALPHIDAGIIIRSIFSIFERIEKVKIAVLSDSARKTCSSG